MHFSTIHVKTTNRGSPTMNSDWKPFSPVWWKRSEWDGEWTDALLRGEGLLLITDTPSLTSAL